MPSADHERLRAYLKRELRRSGMADPEGYIRRNSKRRPPGMAPALFEPPRGPRPLAGGAAAPLEFDA